MVMSKSVADMMPSSNSISAFQAGPLTITSSLQAAYEATMLAALQNAARAASKVVLRTQLGGVLLAMTITGFIAPCGEP